jgi:hypothetical protein
MGIKRFWLICVLMPTLGMCAVAGAAEVAGDSGASEAAYVSSCFPDSAWSGGTASWKDRPCDVLVRPAEDGSVRVLQQTAAYELAECVLPNPREERGRFVAHCHRVPRFRAK